MFKTLLDIKSDIDSVKAQMLSQSLDPNGFCVVPFTTIILEPDGLVGVCRHKGHNFPIGNIKTNTIEEIWNGDFVKQWRREFLEGKPSICSTEVKHRQCHLCPDNNKLLNFSTLKEHQETPILKLTANFNGKCNLQCQMCDVWKLPNGLYDELNFWEPAQKQIFPYLKEIDMLSGEPFIQTDTFRLINTVSSLNPDCLWTFTTNAHWKFNRKIEEHLNKIKIKTIIVSIDSINAHTYQKIRYPGKLSQVLETLDKMLEYQAAAENKFRIVANFLIQQDNAFECLDIIKFCYEKKINPLLTFLYEPTPFSLSTLPYEEKLKFLEFYLEKSSVIEMAHLKKILHPIIESLLPIDKAVYLNRIHENRLRYS